MASLLWAFDWLTDYYSYFWCYNLLRFPCLTFNWVSATKQWEHLCFLFPDHSFYRHSLIFLTKHLPRLFKLFLFDPRVIFSFIYFRLCLPVKNRLSYWAPAVIWLSTCLPTLMKGFCTHHDIFIDFCMRNEISYFSSHSVIQLLFFIES